MSRFRFWLLFAATALVALTLLSPKLPLPGRFYRVVFTLDITQSMNVEDVLQDGHSVRRLELAKQAVWRSIESMPCDSQVGFAIFTEHRSYLILSPIEICANYRELQQILDNIDWQMAWRSSSEVAKGLISAMRVGTSLQPPARIVFISDGHEAPPIHPDLRQVPKKAAVDQVGAIVGVGGDELSPIPVYSPEGKITGYWRAQDIVQADVFSSGRDGSGEAMVAADGSKLSAPASSGNEHLSSLRESWLKQLASDAGYRYVRLQTPEQTARFLVGSALADSKSVETDIRGLFAGVALLLIVLAYLPQSVWEKTK